MITDQGKTYDYEKIKNMGDKLSISRFNFHHTSRLTIVGGLSLQYPFMSIHFFWFFQTLDSLAFPSWASQAQASPSAKAPEGWWTKVPQTLLKQHGLIFKSKTCLLVLFRFFCFARRALTLT